jgi:MFS superfamily sulfate permease-like transporter
MDGDLFKTPRRRVRQGALSVALVGIATATADVTAGVAVVLVAALVLLVDRRVARSGRVPWGGR